MSEELKEITRLCKIIKDKDKEIEILSKERSKTYENGLNYFLELQEKKEEIERLNNIIKEAIEYHDNCINNSLDLDKIDDNEKLAYKVAYGIHNNYLKILKGE